MAIGDQTWTLINGLRIHIDSELDVALAEWVRAWALTWSELSDEWQTLMMDVAAARAAGKEPTAAKVLRTRRAKRALDLSWESIRDLCNELDVRVERVLPDLVKSAPKWQRDLFASQLPAKMSDAQIDAFLRDVDAARLSTIVERAAEQIHSLTRPLPDFVTRTMKGELIRGVALGDNPSTTAGRIVKRVGDRFDLGRTRALVIARTEMLDAHREGTRAWDMDNLDVLTGWQWVAKLDRRTCPGCWSMHGRTFPVKVAGPLDHQQGRCARLPVAKSWADLGLGDLDEPEDLMPDAEQVFAALPREDQLAIMGARRLELLQSGKTSWGELAQRRSTTGWRDSYAPAPVGSLAS